MLQPQTLGLTSVTFGGKFTTSPTPTSLTVVKNSPGRLASILVVTANSTNPILIYDNTSAASGTVIGVVPASAAVGTLIQCQMPADNGITIAGTASAGQITVNFD